MISMKKWIALIALITLLACASWMGAQLLLYTQDIFAHFPLLGK